MQEQKAIKYSGGVCHKTQIDLTYNANHMEGSRLTYNQTRYIFETNTIGAEKEVLNVDDVIETVNHFRCIDMPMVALHWEKYFQHICEKYNKIYKAEMPKVTPHVCRHTFCSNMAKSGMNPKTLQKIMGHSDIGVTLNTYTHVGFEDIQKEMKKICS